jgi:2-polyprenyl-3-methyl-5-hydroxy-6-metoxy-1,4-benzoquinol methylase
MEAKLEVYDPKWAFLPERYREKWVGPVTDAAAAAIRPGSSVLDVGGGAMPIIPTAARPEGTTYVGLDVAEGEMEKAPDGSYDETYVAEIEKPPSELLERFDLAVSFQVLEHVNSMEQALEGTRACLKPGGTFVSQMTGGKAWFAMLNRMIPDSVAEFGMEKLLGREPETVFHANYDASTYSDLIELLGSWKSVKLQPRYLGATYLSFSRPLAWAYVHGYENRLVRRDKRDFATHLVLTAVK